MKTKIKRHYRSVVSVLLSVCLLVSCMTVGLIATDAARVTDSESVGAEFAVTSLSCYVSKQSDPSGNVYNYTNLPKDTKFEFTVPSNSEKLKFGFSVTYVDSQGTTHTNVWCKNGDLGTFQDDKLPESNVNKYMKDNASSENFYVFSAGTWQIWWDRAEQKDNGDHVEIQYTLRKKPTEYTVSLNSVDHATAVVTYSGGEIAESGSANLEAGTSVTVVVTPDSGYVATTVSVNGGSAIALTDMGNGTYTYTYTVNAATAFTLGSTKPKAASSITLTPALTELTTAGAAATLTATAVSPVDNALTYKLYTDAGTLVDTKPVTDGGAAEFTVTPSVDISKYYVTVEKTSDSTYASVKSTTVKVTNSAYVTAKYALTGRIIDKSDSYWDTNATNNSKQLNVNEHMSGSVFRYKYVPSEHGTPTQASHVDFRLINTSNTSKIYGGNANPQTMLNKMYYTTMASPVNNCYRLPDYTGSYYIYVDQSTEPPMIWCEKIPSTSVKIYAKDGVIRRNAGSDSDSEYWRFAARANTVLSKASGSTKNLTNYNASANTYYEYGEMEKGGSITLTTTLESSLKDYYIKGYSINGVVYQLLDPPALDSNNKSVSTYTFAIPEDFPDDYLEITPIYFKRSNEGCITFYVEGYDEEVQRSGWGNTIFADFFYASGHDEGYPGQPMVYYGGRYFMQVSTTGNKAGDTGTLGKIMGVTLNNGQWDYVHCDQVKAVGDNKQTYDFSNFHKIYTEKSDDNLDAITFSFKYENKLDNFGRSINYPTTITESTFDSDNGNGWEYLTNYYKEKVDIFGNVLTDEQAAQEPLLIVSNGYVSGYEGKYATEWAIYNSTGTSKLGVIPSSALVLESADRFDSTDYSDASGAPRTLSGYKSTYNALKDESKALYKPAIITFEKDVYSNSGMKIDGSADGNQYGYRLDGLWYFSQKNRQVSANVEIEYSENYYSAFSPKWYKDEFAGSTNVGTYTQTKAYFTDTGFENQTTEGPVTADSTKFYNFTAEATGKWMLKGWYLKDGDKYIEIVSPSLPAAQSARDANATFVARFVPYPSGTVYISHEIKPGSEGLATATVNSVWIADDTDDTNIAAITTNNGDVSAIGSQYISTVNKDKYLKIQLDTTPASGADLLGFYYDVQKTDPIVYNALTQGTDIVENKITVPTVNIPSKQAVIYVKIDHFFRHNDTTDEDEFIEDNDTLNFYSELIVSSKSFTVTKKLAEDYTESDAFTIKVETSTDGTSWSDYANQAYTSTGTGGNTNDTGLASIHQKETLTFANIAVGTYVRITEPATVKDYIFDSASAVKQNDSASPKTDISTPANTTANNGCFFQITDDNVDVTINNKRQEYKWIIKFEYNSRLWSTQGYQADGTFTKDQLETFTTYTEVTDHTTGYTGPGIKFKSPEDKAAFVTQYLPHEDNFRQEVTWIAAEASENYNANFKQISMSLTAHYTDAQQLTVQYQFPCKMTHNNAGSVATETDANGHARVYDSSVSTFTPDNVQYMNWYCLNDVKLSNGVPTGEPIFVSAPESIIDATDGNKVKYFHHWSVKTADGNVEYTKCYNREYNYAFYQDSIVTPVYVEANQPFNHTVVSEEERIENPATITFLEASRNQWNNKQCGTAKNVWNANGLYSDYGDRIFVDFVLDLHYIENGKNLQLNTIPEAQRSKYHAGLLIQQLGELDKYTEGEQEGKYITDSAHYASKYASEDGKTAAMTALTGGTATKENSYYNSVISVADFDNKNELEYYYNFANISQGAPYRTCTAYKNYAFRAYTYLYVDDGQKIISAPVYFTMYDIASIENLYDIAQTKS